MPGMKPLSMGDAFWLAVLCFVLAAWGWNRGRLATRIESFHEYSDAFQALTPGEYESWNMGLTLPTRPRIDLTRTRNKTPRDQALP